MSAKADAYTVALQLPERTLAQFDTLVRHGHFANRQTAIVAAEVMVLHARLLHTHSQAISS